MKFLTRQEIIDKLQSLPDLPVVIQLDCDILSSSGITSVEVRNSAKGSHYIDDQEYSNRRCYSVEGETTEQVIWIS